MIHNDEVDTDDDGQSQGDDAEPQHLAGPEECRREYTAAPAERGTPRCQVDAAPVVIIVVEDVDAAVRQRQADEGEQRMSEVKEPVKPGVNGSGARYTGRRKGRGYPFSGAPATFMPRSSMMIWGP